MIVFALRHADRTPADDLSPAGVERSELLARMLGESGVRTAYCSDAIRTQRTVEPLQKLLGADFTRVVDVADPNDIPAHVNRVVDQVKALPDNAVAVVVGHSNTVGRIIKGLTGRTIDRIEDHEFDKLFALFVAANGAATVAPLRYGKAT